MSRAIAESLSLLSETLDNCKTNLTEKQVADVDNIKISDVDEKIAEIKSGGGDYSGLYSQFIQKVEIASQSSEDYKEVKFGETFNLTGKENFKIKLTSASESPYSYGIFCADSLLNSIRNTGFLNKQTCLIENLINNQTGGVHVCCLFGSNCDLFFYFKLIEPYYG